METNCAGNCCETSINSVTGPKGDKGETGATGPQGATGPAGTNGTNGSNGVNATILSGTGTTTLSSANSGSTVYFNSTTGAIIKLPVVPTVGDYFDFNVLTTVTSGSIVIDATSGSHFLGFLFMKKAATIDLIQVPSAALSDTHVTLTSTVGGLIGGQFRITYEAANQYIITGQTYGTTTTSPFS